MRLTKRWRATTRPDALSTPGSGCDSARTKNVIGIHAKVLGRLALPAAVLAAILGCGPRPQQISDSGFGAYEVSASTWPDSLVVAWYDTRDGNAEVYVRLLDAAGRPTSG